MYLGQIKKILTLKTVSVLGVLVLALFLRTYNINNHVLFTIDEEYLFNFAQTIVDDFHVIFSGMTISVGFYMGPFWIYLTSFFLYFFKDIIFFGYLAAILGTVTTLLIFITGTNFFNFKVGLLSSLLYATLPLIVFYDQRYWNNTPIPFLSIIMLLSLVNTFKNQKWWIIFALAFGFIFHTNLSLFPFALTAIIVLYYQRKKISRKIIFLSFAAFILIYSPLLVFDYYHNWDDLRFPIRALNQQNGAGNSSLNVGAHTNALLQALGRVWYLNPGANFVDEVHWGCTSLSASGVEPKVDQVTTRTNTPLWLGGLFLLFFSWFLLKKENFKRNELKIISFIIFLFLTFFLIFPGGAFEYYLLGVFPLLVFLPPLLWESLSGIKKAVAALVIVLMVLLGINTVLKSNTSLGLADQKNVIFEVMKVVGDKSYKLVESGGCRRYAGWRYLFKMYGKVPVESSIDSTFGWLYPQELTKKKADYLVIVSEKRIDPNLVIKGASEVQSGGFKAYVIKSQ